MTLPSDEPRGQQVLAALAELSRDRVGSPSPAQLNQGLQALSANIARGDARRRGLRRWSLAAGATAVVSIAATMFLSRPAPQGPSRIALAYAIEGGTMVEGGYLRDTGADGIKLSFSEGTEFVLGPRTRGRLGTVDSAGARIAIEEGTASFQVAPRPGAKWMVDVGPFLVTVKGTAFTVSWDAANERFELNLRHGRVTISGPVSGGDIALRAGQRLVVNLPKGETLITEQNPDQRSVGAPAPLIAPAPVAAVRPAARPRTMAAKVVEHRWAEALAAGRLDEVLLEAEQAGLKSVLEEASMEELFALATAARYRQRVDLAHDALLAERRRFAGSPRALDAAFFLGRLAESSERGTRAVEWYDEYLVQAPSGRYASEALGRKMIATSKTEGAARTTRLAQEYLRRFPNGSYAGSARALVRSP